MAGLDPAIHVLLCHRSRRKELDVKKPARKPDHSGSTLDSLLAEDGLLEEVEAVAIARVKRWRKDPGFVDRSETFDEFLAKDSLLADTENAALKEIAADRKKLGPKPRVG